MQIAAATLILLAPTLAIAQHKVTEGRASVTLPAAAERKDGIQDIPAGKVTAVEYVVQRGAIKYVFTTATFSFPPTEDWETWKDNMTSHGAEQVLSYKPFSAGVCRGHELRTENVSAKTAGIFRGCSVGERFFQTMVVMPLGTALPPEGKLFLDSFTVAAAPQAPGKPNFTGDWKLNFDASYFGVEKMERHGIRKMILHMGGNLSQSTTQLDGVGQPLSHDQLSLTIGAIPQLIDRTLPDGNHQSFKFQAVWEGRELVITETIAKGMPVMNQRWNLSPNGRRLTIVTKSGTALTLSLPPFRYIFEK